MRRYGQPAICTIEGCENRTQARGWCWKHYARWYRYGDPLYVPPPRPTKNRRCDIPGCEEKHGAHGLCKRHYYMCRSRGIDPSPEAWREYEIGKALEILGRYDLLATSLFSDYWQENLTKLLARAPNEVSLRISRPSHSELGGR